MKKVIPENVIARQANIGENYGDIWASFNLDLISNPGKIRVSPKVDFTTSSGDNALFVKPYAFIRNQASTAAVDSYFAICDQAVFVRRVDAATAFVKDTYTDSPTSVLSALYSDAININGTLAITTKQEIYQLTRTNSVSTEGVWITNWGTATLGRALVNNIPHPVCLGFDNVFLVGDQVAVDNEGASGERVGQASVHTVTATNTATLNRLVFPADFEILWIRSSSSNYWIGTRHKYGGEGKVFSWDGFSENYVGDYGVGAEISFAGVIKDGICYTINNNGQLLQFNGAGFSEIARLPIAFHKTDRWDNDGAVPPTIGYSVHRNGIALIDNKINILLGAGIDGNNNEFLENMVSGIWEYTKDTGLYHKYSITKGNNAAIRDYGSPVLVFPGALFEVGKAYRGFFAGAQLYTDGSSTLTSVIGNISGDTNEKLGYFITPRIYAEQIEEIWQKIFLNYKALTTTGHYITVKYRQSVDYTPTFDQLGTWTSTTTFTTTATEMANVAVGDEIEILSGEGSGLSASITAISGSYTVTIDTALTSASGDFRFRVSNWTDITDITDLVSAYKEFSVGKNSNWIQFKVIMFGTGDSPEIEKLTVVSKPQIS